jgi:hypothetical protein
MTQKRAQPVSGQAEGRQALICGRPAIRRPTQDEGDDLQVESVEGSDDRYRVVTDAEGTEPACPLTRLVG